MPPLLIENNAAPIPLPSAAHKIFRCSRFTCTTSSTAQPSYSDLCCSEVTDFWPNKSSNSGFASPISLYLGHKIKATHSGFAASYTTVYQLQCMLFTTLFMKRLRDLYSVSPHSPPLRSRTWITPIPLADLGSVLSNQPTLNASLIYLCHTSIRSLQDISWVSALLN